MPLLLLWMATRWPSASMPRKGREGVWATKEGVPPASLCFSSKALLDNVKALTPQGVVIAFDTAEPTFRHEARRHYIAATANVAPEHFFQSDWPNRRRSSLGPMDLAPVQATGFSRRKKRQCSATLATGPANAPLGGCASSRVNRDLSSSSMTRATIAVPLHGWCPYAKSSGPLPDPESEGVVAKLRRDAEERWWTQGPHPRLPATQNIPRL